VGRRILLLTLIESAFAATLVSGTMLLLGLSLPVALLLGAVAVATAPASTLMVIREADSRGPLTDNLLGIIALNNIYCITTYSLIAAGIDLTVALSGPGEVSALESLYRSVYPLVWQLIGSVALGYLVGLVLGLWSAQVSESGEMLILLAGSILLCVGAARFLDLSPLIASMAVGATMVNLSPRGRALFDALSGTDPPFYAIFFVLAGADMDVALVREMGWLGVGYVGARACGKFFGARLGARRLGLDEGVQRYLGFALLAQAGLAVGLTIVIQNRFPAYADTVSTIVLASVGIHEMFGPVLTRFALDRAGEVGAEPSEPQTTLLAVD
jgi:Kef-type K+ transport system membrane component KefB